MSFILDALRKSEHERQRQTGPGIADLTPVSARTGLPIWAIALGALLIINIAVVLVLVLRGEPAPPAAAPTAQPVAQAIAPAATSPDPVVQQPGTVEPAPRAQAPATRQAPELEEVDTADADFAETIDEPDPAIDEPSDAELAAAMRAATPQESFDDENLPTINDVTLQGSSIPELHLDIHVYATAPAERFVFINMRKYREGDQTPEGTRVERITRDGVVLNHRGVRFLMPRQ